MLREAVTILEKETGQPSCLEETLRSGELLISCAESSRDEAFLSCLLCGGGLSVMKQLLSHLCKSPLTPTPICHHNKNSVVHQAGLIQSLLWSVVGFHSGGSRGRCVRACVCVVFSGKVSQHNSL